MRVSLVWRSMAARRVAQRTCDRGPIPCAGIEAKTADTQVRRELRISRAIADHGRVRAAPPVVGKVVTHEPRARLARIAPLVRETCVDQHFAEFDALRTQDSEQQRVRTVEGFARERGRTEAILIADHDKLVTCVTATL